MDHQSWFGVGSRTTEVSDLLLTILTIVVTGE